MIFNKNCSIIILLEVMYMVWDLLDEHKTAYDSDMCNKINKLTDMFDELLMHINNNIYPLEMCVDVFFCNNSIKHSVPQIISKYYDVFVDKNQTKKYFDKELELQKIDEGTIQEVFERLFLIDNSYSKESIDINSANIKRVTANLKKELECNYVERYELNKETLEYLSDVYMGILFYGSILKCNQYAIMILTGTTE